MMTSLAIFDLDGTLVDTPRAIVETFCEAFAALGLAPRDTARIRATIGLPLEQAFSRLMEVPLDDALVARAIRQYQGAFREQVLPRAEQLLFPDVERGLAALRARGVRLAVATSKFHSSADALLTAATLRGFFDVVVGADQVTRPKPAPEMGLRILRELSVAPEHAVMVGDTTHDLHMARAAGLRSIAVTYGVHGLDELKTAEPTWIAHSFREVLDYLSTGPRQD
ncbi:HAD family hydrolase [Myxococcus sp. K38C18041901]|uniref:HAD family hydrolase n=1 Tax=Myxococcus guangdongensis TaxID=2906760 RepID=UPI0020A74DE4|nr:HAD family hydrolase [Myxococcus guangdongensis]MCP3061445.1 HAD family hydrolase [Myxococcus guangdongensis]